MNSIAILKKTLALLAGAAVIVFAIAGCHRNEIARTTMAEQLPPSALPTLVKRTAPSVAVPSYKPTPIPVTPVPPGGVSAEDLEFVVTHQPIARQTGVASWYGAPYKGRKAANGQIFDDEAMTAAHRTLPMGSLIKVTNLKTGQSGVMRITDRGPFVKGRVIDLTVEAAKATGIYLAGWAQVRIDVYQTPKPISTGGRWCVQIGAFLSEPEALRMKTELEREYRDAQLIEFPGVDGYWVRIRPEGDDREMAEYIASHLHPSEGEAFLTRLD
jgi:rare lipoprotein A